MCLVVGKSKSIYYLHRDILTSRCPYFASSFHFYGANDPAEAEKMCILDDYDYPDAFKIFIMYLYLSRYEVPLGRSLAKTCILHTQVYVLAERLCMDDLKATALQKMSVALGEGSWNRFSVDLEPVVVIQLLRTVYEGTRDDGRWTKFNVSEDRVLDGCQDGNVPATQISEAVDESVTVSTEEVSIAEDAPVREDALGPGQASVPENAADYIFTTTPLEPEPEPEPAEDEGVEEGQGVYHSLSWALTDVTHKMQCADC